MKFACLLVCISIFCNVKAQKNDFLLEDFNNINSWQQDFKNFINNSENYILDTSTTYSSDYISKQIPKINLNEDSTVWKIDINTNFTNSSANYFEIFLVGNSLNTSDENFNGISIATGIFKPYNSLSLIKYNGKNKEQIYCNQKKFTSSVVTVTRSKLGVWRINDEIIYSEEPIMEDLYSEFIIVKFKFNKTGAQKFSFKFIEFYQGSDIQEPEPEPEQYPQANFSEIVINEIMADISPKPFALPDKKYIELFNNSTINYNIKNYKLIIGNDSIIFSDITLKSNDYIIISNEKSYSNYGNYFHSQITDKLTIAGKKIILKNADNQIIDSLTYSINLYNDENKNSGGFALERIDPENNCYQNNNWKASLDLSGGTPGRINSVYAINIDNSLPQILNYETINNQTFKIEFSKPIFSIDAKLNKIKAETKDISAQKSIVQFPNSLTEGENILKISAMDFCKNTLEDTIFTINYTKFEVEKIYAINKNQVMINFSTKIQNAEIKNFQLKNNSTQPIVVNITSDKKGVLLTFEENFVNKEKYELNIYNLKNTISDTLKINTYKFQYQKLEYQDIVINEILFNPKKGAKRFVELYNNSNNEILLYGLKFTNVLTEKSCIIDSIIFLQPKNYAVLTPDSLDIKNNYDCGKIFIQNKKFPTLNEKEGIITIQSIENTTLDSVYYSKNMHNKFLTSTDGVSLERVSFSDSFTWRSAAESSLFATPGKENSQKDFLDEILEDQTEEKIAITNTYTNEITIENQLFTPLNEDKMYTIHFNFKNQETTLNIYIYDTKGRLKRTLKKNFVVSRGDTVFWDGFDDDSNRCKTGIYIVLINALDQQGMSKNYKKVCVIGTNN